MREIKFRGKDNKFEWIYGDLLQNSDDDKKMIVDNKNDLYFVESETVGQFTGLHDKNGKEIYEGDIVKGKYMYKEYLWLVEFNNHVSCLSGFTLKAINHGKSCVHAGMFSEERREVIGNVHDNTELLEDK